MGALKNTEHSLVSQQPNNSHPAFSLPAPPLPPSTDVALALGESGTAGRTGVLLLHSTLRPITPHRKTPVFLQLLARRSTAFLVQQDASQGGYLLRRESLLDGRKKVR